RKGREYSDNGHNDQKLDQRKSISLFHTTCSPIELLPIRAVFLSLIYSFRLSQGRSRKPMANISFKTKGNNSIGGCNSQFYLPYSQNGTGNGPCFHIVSWSYMVWDLLRYFDDTYYQ